MITPRELHDFLSARMPHYIQMLHTLVEANSYTLNISGVNRQGDLTADFFKAFGFTDERIPSVYQQHGAHRVLSRGGRSNLPIGLVSHLDTVFPPEEEVRNRFVWRPEGNRIHGPGTVDIKGGTVAIYMLLDALQSLVPDRFEAVNWLVLLDASEETVSDDFGRLCVERLRGGLGCLIFEGGKFEDRCFGLVVARKGRAIYRVVASGRAAHAGSSHAQGRNAIVLLARAIAYFAGLTDYAREVTVNIGSMQGGGPVNRVPHRAEAMLELRAFDMDLYRERKEAIENVAKHLGLTPDEGTLTIELQNETPPWNRNAQSEALLEIWRESAQEAGYMVSAEARGGLSDGNYIWQALPTMDGLGPDGDFDHCSEHDPAQGKEQEYIAIESLIPKTVVNVLGVLKMVGSCPFEPLLADV